MTVPAINATLGSTRPAPAASLGTTARPVAATLALARAEAHLLLRSATLWISTVLATALGVASSWTRMQTWETFAQSAGFASLVLAGGLLLAGHLAAGRDHRGAMTETTHTLPAPTHRRIAALLVYVPVAVGVGFLAAGIQLLCLLPHPPAGTLQLPQVLVTVVTPPLGAVIGIAVGRWAPAAAAGPLTLVATAVLVLTLPSIGNGGSNIGWWLAPVVTRSAGLPGMPQPHDLHLAYLLALLAMVVATALVRRRRLWWSVVAALSLLAAGGTAVLQADPASDAITADDQQRYAGPATQQCQSVTGVRYCALRGFSSWVPLWRDAVEPVVAVLPAAAHDRLPTVRQVPDTVFDTDGIPDAGVVSTGLSWGQHGRWAEESRATLAMAYARAVTGLPAARWITPTVPGEPLEEFRCSGSAQARTVVALWLAAQALPDGAHRLATHSIRLYPVDYGQPEIDAATTLLRLPRAQVTAALAATWPAVTSAKTGTDVLGPLGVRVPPATATQIAPCR